MVIILLSQIIPMRLRKQVFFTFINYSRCTYWLLEINQNYDEIIIYVYKGKNEYFYFSQTLFLMTLTNILNQ